MKNNFCFMVTRPNPAGEELCRLIQASGASAIHLPTIDIRPPDDLSEFQQALNNLPQQDWLIFISPQAVYHSIAAIRQTWPNLPKRVKFAAVGAATTQALQAANYSAVLFPETEWNSEALLALPDLQNLTGKKITLVKGQGGRTHLAEILSARGANVSAMTAYQRSLPKIDPQPYQALIAQNKINGIICTSFTAVLHLQRLLGEAIWANLKKTPLIVISERIKKLAETLGFQTIWLANNASHQAIMAVIKEMMQ